MGKLSTYDARQIIQTFDNDNSGCIELEEFRQLMKMTLEANENYEEAWEAFNAIDSNGNKMISRRELRDLCALMNKNVTTDEVNSLFDTIDTDHSGTINFDEF